ncbi:DUF4383 domain-containing protein [Saccharopolyspora thermophila]|nr:DUF4383 domain-containing protein [Saccharopolyspora subtropica]
MATRTRGAAAWQVVLVAQGLVLVVLGLAGLVSGGWQTSGDYPALWIFQFNAAHSSLLLGWGVLAVVASWWRWSTAAFAAAQMVGGILLFLYGTAESTVGESRTVLSLDPAENFLHAGLAVLGFLILCGVASAPARGPRPRRAVHHGH